MKRIVHVINGQLRLPLSATKQATVTLQPQNTLFDIQKQLQKEGKVSFFNDSDVNLSLSTKVQDLLDVFQIQINNVKFVVLPLESQNQKFRDICREVQLPDYDFQDTLEFISQIKSKIQTSQPDEKIPAQKINKSIQELMESIHSQSFKDQYTSVESEIRQLKSQIEPMMQLKQKLTKKANFRTTLLLWSGLGVLTSQFSFIAAGTYVFFSWDVMEPLAYLMLLGNTIVGTSFYAYNKQSFERQNFATFMRSSLTDKYLKGYGISSQEIQDLQSQIADLENQKNQLLIKMNLVTES